VGALTPHRFGRLTGLEGAVHEINDRRHLRFGIFEADLRAGELTKRGVRLRLQEQPFQLLAALLENPGELVTREQLRNKLWPGITVDFDHGLNKAISKIREALNDSAENPRFVETVARRGYRFIGPVEALGMSPDNEQQAATFEQSCRPSDLSSTDAIIPSNRRLRPTALVYFCFGLALVIAASWSWLLYVRSPAPPQIHSLAVLPLENLSADPAQDYFADGMTDELITDLAKINALRVISRTSVMAYRNVRKPLTQIARELNVEAVVEGTVMRSGEQVRITAQVIRVPDERHIWAESYEGDLKDTLALQSQIARTIAAQIQATLSGREQAALANSKVVNPDAYEAYLKGRYFWNKRTPGDLTKAIGYFHHAIDKDPTYAEAYVGLADAYALSGDWEYGIMSPADAFPAAKAAATRALSLNDNLGDAHASLAFVLDLYDWNWDSAEKEYERALALNPGYATAHQWYGWHLIETGNYKEGIAELRKAQSLDPLSLIVGADLADALSIAHRFDEAVQQSRKTLELAPDFAIAHYELGQAFEQKGMHNEAIKEFQRAIDLSGHDGTLDANLAYVYAVTGRREEATKIAMDLETEHDQNSSSDANVALVYAGLHDNDQAIIWLNKAFEMRFNPSILLRPAFDDLRSDPRFREIVNRIGLPQLAEPIGKAAP
jgi:TolB-like protein/DNA-binding winged helix-turn-helix (wHTH) protein/Tfp pilus assembly protein PilF